MGHRLFSLHSISFGDYYEDHVYAMSHKIFRNSKRTFVKKMLQIMMRYNLFSFNSISLSLLQITFTAERGGAAPTITVDNITIYETPYIGKYSWIRHWQRSIIGAYNHENWPRDRGQIKGGGGESNGPGLKKGPRKIEVEGSTVQIH